MTKVILATGGSGGHIFPALEVGRALKGMSCDVEMWGAFGKFAEVITKEGFVTHTLVSAGLTGGLWNRVKAVARIVKAFGAAFRQLGVARPNVVVGFGGYGAFPVVAAAFVRGLPTMIHEQNVMPGKANRVLAIFARRIAISFEDSRKHFSVKRSVLTGCPTKTQDRLISDPLKHFGLVPGRLTILVLGGSQGSERINHAVVDVMKRIHAYEPCQVIHSCGDRDASRIKQEYQANGIVHYVSSFIGEMESAYQAADVVVSRAGAVTVTEIARYRKASVLVPYPYAAAHQVENARVLCRRGAALMLEQSQLTAQALEESILKIREESKKERFEDCFQGVCIPDAAHRLAREACLLGAK